MKCESSLNGLKYYFPELIKRNKKRNPQAKDGDTITYLIKVWIITLGKPGFEPRYLLPA